MPFGTRFIARISFYLRVLLGNISSNRTHPVLIDDHHKKGSDCCESRENISRLFQNKSLPNFRAKGNFRMEFISWKVAEDLSRQKVSTFSKYSCTNLKKKLKMKKNMANFWKIEGEVSENSNQKLDWVLVFKWCVFVWDRSCLFVGLS